MIQFLMDNLIGILGFLFGSGGIVLWFLERKKYNEVVAGLKAENESKELDNNTKLINLYKESLDDLGARYEAKFKDVTDAYDRKMKLLEEEINLRERIITSLKRENRDLKTRIKVLENGNNSS
jgi:hypothetical protein